MSDIRCDVIATGSSGNAVVLEDSVLIDCGVSFKKLAPYVHRLKLVLLTHIHGDHFRPSTIRRLADFRPTLRFGCGPWLAGPLLDCGVRPENIDVLKEQTPMQYGDHLTVIRFGLAHDVPNSGYKLHFYGSSAPHRGSVIYATDTNTLEDVDAFNYDLYLVEANHTEEEIAARIAAKEETGEYAYEVHARENHMSKEKTDAWLLENMGDDSRVIYLHRHEGLDLEGGS